MEAGRTEASDDAGRLERWRRGDLTGLRELVDHYRRPLYGFILRMCDGRDEADDLFQETWLRALRGLRRYRHGHFIGWLFRIAHNVIMDRHRRRRPEISLNDAGTDTIRDLDLADTCARTPDQAMDARDLGRRIGRAVQALPEEQRAVFLMRMEGDLPFKTIARIQGTSINTALARMRYATGKLREALAEDYASRVLSKVL